MSGSGSGDGGYEDYSNTYNGGGGGYSEPTWDIPEEPNYYYEAPRDAYYGTSSGSVYNYYYSGVGYQYLDNYVPYQEEQDHDHEPEVYEYQQIRYSPNQYIDRPPEEIQMSTPLLVVILCMGSFLIIFSMVYCYYDRKEGLPNTDENG